MSAYIKITISDDIRCSINQGLNRVICYIGDKSRDGTSYRIDSDSLKAGIKIINRRLRKWSMNPIKNLVCAKKDKKNNKYYWKIHRRRTSRVLQAIKYELSKCSTNEEIVQLFEEIYVYLHRMFGENIERIESDILGRAYIRDLYIKLGDSKYKEDQKDINRIIKGFRAYNGTILRR